MVNGNANSATPRAVAVNLALRLILFHSRCSRERGTGPPSCPILPYPVHLSGEQRLLLLSQQGMVMDVGLPAASRQKSGRSEKAAAGKTGSV